MEDVIDSPKAMEISNILLKRYTCLFGIVNEPRSKQMLVSDLDIPRSTLDDIVRELEEVGLVEYKNGEWLPTQLGRTACRIQTNYLNQLKSLINIEPVIKELCIDYEISQEFITDSDLHVTPTSVPDAVVSKLLHMAKPATHVQVATPCVFTGYVDTLIQSGMSGRDSTFEMIVSPSVKEQLQSMKLTSLADALEAQSASIMCGCMPTSLGISVFDEDYAAVLVFTSNGLAGMISNDSVDAINWAERKYERIREESVPLDQWEK